MANQVNTHEAYAYGFDVEGNEEKALVAPRHKHSAVETPSRKVKDPKLKLWLTNENCLFLEDIMYCFQYQDLWSITEEDFNALSTNLEPGEKIRFRQALKAAQTRYSMGRPQKQKADKYEDIFKVILIGNNKVGKTNILRRFARDEFDPLYEETIGLKCEDVIVEIPDNKNVKLQIYDTSGSHEFGTINQAFFRKAHGAIIVYDITDQKSFNDIEMWVEKVNMQVTDKAWKILVANKCDLEHQRVISKEQGQKAAHQHGLKFMECSAKMANNVDEMFSISAQYLLSIWDEQETVQGNDNQCCCVCL